MSDYRFRGNSLSEGKPALQANVAYDGKSGWYAGQFASIAELDRPSIRTQANTYLGYAQRLNAGDSWDLGASYTSYPSNGRYNYGEIFLGITTEQFATKLFVSPDYLGSRERLFYLEANASKSLDKRTNLIGRIAYQRAIFNEKSLYAMQASGFDGQLSVQTRYESWSLQMSWVFNCRREASATRAQGVPKNALIGNVSYLF